MMKLLGDLDLHMIFRILQRKSEDGLETGPLHAEAMHAIYHIVLFFSIFENKDDITSKRINFIYPSVVLGSLFICCELFIS